MQLFAGVRSGNRIAIFARILEVIAPFRPDLFYLETRQTYHSTSRFAIVIFFIAWLVVDRRGLVLA